MDKVRSMVKWMTALVALFMLAGCSAMLATVGTEESEIIHRGMHLADVTERLGPPQSIVEFDQPLTYDDLIARVDMPITIRPQLPSSSGMHVEAVPGPYDLLLTEARYRFVGKLKYKHDAGDSVAVNLITN